MKSPRLCTASILRNKSRRKVKITIRELRQALNEIENQNMTVKELRAILFEQEDQDKEVSPYNLLEITLKK